MRISDWSSDVCSSDLGHNHSTVPLLALQAPRLGGVRGYLAPSSRVSTTGLRTNNAFKPKPLRSANHMAGKVCHVLRSTARLGLTLVLGASHLQLKRFSALVYKGRPSTTLTSGFGP